MKYHKHFPLRSLLLLTITGLSTTPALSLISSAPDPEMEDHSPSLAQSSSPSFCKDMGPRFSYFPLWMECYNKLLPDKQVRVISSLEGWSARQVLDTNRIQNPHH